MIKKKWLLKEKLLLMMVFFINFTLITFFFLGYVDDQEISFTQIGKDCKIEVINIFLLLNFIFIYKGCSHSESISYYDY